MNEKALEKIENLIKIFDEREYMSKLTILGNHTKEVCIIRRNDGSFSIDGEVFRNIKEIAMKVVDLISILGCREISRMEYSIVRFNESTTKFVYEDVVL